MILKFKTSLKCNNCINAIEPNMKSLKGIKSWNVDLTARPATLEVDSDTATPEEIINAVQEAGYKIELVN